MNNDKDKQNSNGALTDSFRGYATLLRQIKQRVLLAQQKAICAANEEMLRMYWDIGGMLQQSQDADGWGKKTLQRLAEDMKNDYPAIKGFSVRNMQCMMQFYAEYNQELTMVKSSSKPIAKPVVAQLTLSNAITQPVVAQLTKYNFTLPIKHLDWSHNLILMQQVKDIKARYWYMVQCITSHWAKRYLQEAIKLDYYGKHGALANNFAATLTPPEASEVASMLKDPYIFDMLTFTDKYNERDVEIGLVEHVEKFLIEMGAGFAFMGRQYHIEVSGDDYYIDILMYNAFMHRYLVVELKDTEFKPEYIGKLNFYCSAVDDILCREGDNRTIGLLLCKTKDKIKAEYALRDIQKPIGISDYELGQALPKDFRGSLPAIEEIENELYSMMANQNETVCESPYKVIGTMNGMAVCPQCGNKFMIDDEHLLVNSMNEESEAAVICPSCTRLFIVNLVANIPKGYTLCFGKSEGCEWDYCYVNGIRLGQSGISEYAFDNAKKIFPQYLRTIGGLEQIVFPVNLAEGRFDNWTEGVSMDWYMKIRDEGFYYLVAPTGRIQKEWRRGAYVPKLFDWDGKSYGDYIDFKVNMEGKILNYSRNVVSYYLGRIIRGIADKDE